MSTFTDSTFDGGKIPLDENVYIRCNFRNCIMEFGATGPVSMEGCVFSNVRWAFVGPASATLQFLAAMANELGEGGRQVVEHTFAQIMQQGRTSSSEEPPVPAA